MNPFSDRQVGEPAVLARVIGVAGAARHHVAVDIDGIDRVGHGDAVALAQNVENVGAVALAAVGDKDLLGRDLAAAGHKVVLGDRFAQPQVALLGAIAMESFAGAHRVDGGFHGAAAGLGQGLGHITDAQSNDLCLGVGLAESLDPAGDLRKEVARLELEVVAVDLGHCAFAGWRRLSYGGRCPPTTAFNPGFEIGLLSATVWRSKEPGRR